MPNPDFFGNTEDAEKARAYWDERVVHAQKNDAYYTDNDINADPDLVRPFRVSMSCGFCHVAFHPLNPPSDPENPKWEQSVQHHRQSVLDPDRRVFEPGQAGKLHLSRLLPASNRGRSTPHW